MFSTLDIECSAWQEAETFGCSAGQWKKLDDSISFPDSSKCEKLCLAENENGCCYLKNGAGCYWKPNSFSVGEGAGISITCRGAGEIYIIVSKYICSSF